jgi:N-acyl-D-amino-acid deacylase
MRCFRALASLACFATLSAQNIPTTGTTPAELASFDTTMMSLMSKYTVPGAALAVVHNGQLVLARGYGYANEDSNTPVQPDSLFRIASITKPHTAAAIMKLVERGELSLTDHAFQILANIQPLPGFPEDPRIAQITIQELLEHTSGWYGEADGTGYDPMFDVVNIARDAGVTPPADCRTIVRYMLGRPLDTDPGTYYSYLNFGYCVLGQVIEQVSGETVESFVTANVTGPLGNDRSQFGATLTALPGEVTYYDYPGASLASSVFPTGPSLVPWPYGGFSLEANHANGGLVSSTIDLLRFLTSVNGSRGPQLFANPVSGFPGYVPPYGAGWEWVFDGSLPGNNAGLILMPDQSALCFLTNTRPIPSPTANFFSDFTSQFTADVQQVTSWPSNDLFPQFQTSFSVVHSARFQALAAAPDQVVTLFGVNLAGPAQQAASLPLPIMLAGASLSIKDASGNSSAGQLLYASPSQINLVMPGKAATGAATITVQNGAGSTFSTTVQIDPVSPGIFTANSNGTGVPAALAARYSANGTVTPVTVFQCSASGCTPIPMSVGASTDQLIVSLFGTGLRHASSAAAVRATINGQPAPVLFAGAQSQFPGLDQINVQVPFGLAGSGAVPLQLSVDGRQSNVVTLSIQ